MLSHHVKAFRQLQAQFPQADVYFGTSDKVELPKSPFNFKQKQAIAQAHGVDKRKILQAKSPYNAVSYPQFDEDNTVMIFAVGEKDIDRFPFNNLDPESGLQMKKDGTTPTFFQKIDTLQQGALPMNRRGYITLAPTIETGGKVASASAFRDALGKAPDKEAAKKIFVGQFGEYNDAVFNLIYNNIIGNTMNEELNILRKLAGLTEAPIDFTDIKPKDMKAALARPSNAADSDPKKAAFLPPDPAMFHSTIAKSIANRMPPGADINDFETKKKAFMTELVRGPLTLLGEINARLTNDDHGLAVSDHLSFIMRKLDDMGVMELPEEDKNYLFALVANALKNMELVKDPKQDQDDEFDDEDDWGSDGDMEIESISFDDIRESYKVFKKKL